MLPASNACTRTKLKPRVNSGVAMFERLQVGAHYLKDLFEMFVMEPAKDAAVEGAVHTTGTQGLVNAYTNMQHQAQRYTMNGQNMLNQFNHMK
jgi:hypothetical protein